MPTVLLRSYSKTSLSDGESSGTVVALRTAAIASSKFSSPPSGLSFLIPSDTAFRKATFSGYVEGARPCFSFQAFK